MDKIPVDGVALLIALECCVLGLLIGLLLETPAFVFSRNCSKDVGASISSSGSCKGTHDSLETHIHVPTQSLESDFALLFDDFFFGGVDACGS
jgi:hypothetical protein